MHSLKIKISLGLLLIFCLTAGLVVYFGNREIGPALTRAEEKAVRNIFQLVGLNITEAYDQLLDDKVSSIVQHKKNLRSNAELIIQVFEQLNSAGLNKQAAQKEALDWIARSRGAQQQAWMLIDSQGRLLSHPDPLRVGTSVLGVRDISGRPVIELMVTKRASREAEFTVFIDPQGRETKSLGFLQHYNSWNWILALVVDLSEIEAAARLREQQIINNLQISFNQIKLPGNGGVFVFNSQGRRLIQPGDDFLVNYASHLDGLQQKIVQQLNGTTHAQQNSELLQLDFKPPGTSETLQVYTAYFQMFDWYTLVAIPQIAITQPVTRLLLRQAALVGGIFLLGLLVTLSFAKRLSTPLLQLADFAEKLPQTQWREPDMDLSLLDQIAAKRNDEIGQVASSLNYMVKELRLNIHQLVEATSAQEKIASELSIARKIQLGMLPKTFPAFPQITNLDLHAALLPAREVGGDLYDFFLINERRLCFTLGDVSDKGVPAAMFMVLTRTLIKALAPQLESPGELMTKVNDLLCADNPNSMFVTLLLGFMDLETGKIDYANGGHNPPLHLVPHQTPQYLKKTSGPVVGGIPGIAYRDLSLQLQAGEALFLYTDGVTEAQTASEELYSTSRLQEFMADKTSSSAANIVEDLFAELTRFMAGASQYDDIAMLALRYQGKSEPDGKH